MFAFDGIAVLTVVIFTLVGFCIDVAENILEFLCISDMVIIVGTVTENKLYIFVAVGGLYLPYNGFFTIIMINKTFPYAVLTGFLAACGKYCFEPISVVIEYFLALTEFIGVKPCIYPSAVIITAVL